MKPRHKRLRDRRRPRCAVGVAAALVLNAFQQNLVFFFTPSQVAAQRGAAGRAPSASAAWSSRAALQARRHDGALRRHRHRARRSRCVYAGILPDLFKEGKGVVAQGQLGADGVFIAREVLAKHDENYMPPEAADALEAGAAGQPEARRDDARRAASAQAMIPELGHFALCARARRRRSCSGVAADARRGARPAPTGWRWRGRRRRLQFAARRLRLRLPGAELRRQRLLGRSTSRPTRTRALPLHYRIAARLGRPRRLAAALDADARRSGRVAVATLQPPPAREDGRRACSA